jgi:hypothetical protein
MARAAAPSPRRPGRAILRGLLDLRPRPRVERTAVSADDAVARGLAVAKVYAFASVDYPGAAQSLVFDSDGTTAVGAFVFDPSSGTSPTTAFTFAGGVWHLHAWKKTMGALKEVSENARSGWINWPADLLQRSPPRASGQAAG